MPQASFTDLHGVARSALLAERPDLFAEEGDVTDFVLHAVAAGADYVSGRAAATEKALFLDTAFGQDLTTLADDRYGILRNAANEAVGSATLSRPTFAAGGGSVAAGSIIATTFDSLGQTVEFETTALVTFGATDLSKTAAVQAKVAGASGNVAIGTLTRLVTTLFDPTIVVTNAARMAGGSEEESDGSLKERVRTFPTTIRRGTIEALIYGAKTVAGVVSAAVQESATGLVTVYVADGTGYSNAELNAAVQLELENWRAAGVIVQVIAAVPLTVDVAVTIKAKPTFDIAASVGVIQDAIEARMAKLTMGEVMFLDELKGAIASLIGDAFQRATFTTPVGDVTPAENEKIVPGSVTVTAE